MDINTLFNDQSKERVYYVDMVKDYASPVSFKSYVNPDTFIKTPTGINLLPQSKEIVREGITMTDAKARLDKTSKWTEGSEDSILIKPVSTNITPEHFKLLLDRLATVSKDASVDGNRPSADQVKGSNYLKQIVFEVCVWKLGLLKPTVNKFVEMDASLPGPLKVALRTISAVDGDEQYLLRNLITYTGEALAELVATKKLNELLVHGLQEEDFTTTIYYTLREVLFHKFYPSTPTLSLLKDSEYEYFKRAYISLFITSFYPLIHFIYIESLVEMYRKKGDFVNMRIAALVRIPFVLNILTVIKNIGRRKVDGKTTLISTYPEVNTGMTYEQMLESIEKEINAYMKKLSKIDFNGKTTLKDIAIDLHAISAKVASQSEQIDYLKNKIADEQLEIRAYGNVHKTVRGVYRSSYIKFWVLVAFIAFITLASCLALMFMPSSVGTVSIVMALLMCAIVLYNIVVPLIALAKYLTDKE